MKIPASLQPLLDPGQRELPSLLQQLRIGQALSARVLEQIRPGLVRLQIATTTLLARTQLPLTPGTSLKLEVIKAMPQPELRILHAPDPRERQQQAVRSAMARQLPPGEVRQTGKLLAARAHPGPETDATRQFTAIQQASGVRLDTLSPTQLKRALLTSGILHEARLANGLPTNANDNKTRLLRLLTELRNGQHAVDRQALRQEDVPERRDTRRGGDLLLNRLLRLVEGSVARIQLQQAATLPAEEGQRQAWQIDLPIHLPDETHDAMLRIEREARDPSEGGGTGWAVNLVFRFDTIGNLQCRVGIAGEQVSATFWCEREDTHRRVAARLPSLQEALEAQGLQVVHIAGVLGDPPEPLVGVPMPDSLLDERA